MDHGPKIAQVAQLVGDPARANMLARLMDGRALTAKELAEVAGVSPQTTSGHLAKLQGTGLLSVARQGRHRYFHLASAEIARLLEAIMVVAPATATPKTGAPAGGRRDADKLREARTCYDHRRARCRRCRRLARRAQLPRPHARRRRRHAPRPCVLRQSGHRAAHGLTPPCLLPALPRLERTASAYRRRRRRGDPEPRARSRLAAPAEGDARPRLDAHRAPGLRRHLWGPARRVRAAPRRKGRLSAPRRRPTGRLRDRDE
jgi:DNA-binding transcriptional ArsR family regulator